MYRLIFMIVSILSFFSSIYIYLHNTHFGYNYVYLLPLIYGVFSIFMAVNDNKKLLINFIYIIYFIRFVILNVLVVNSGWYEGRAYYSPAYSSYNLGILLMVIEFISINICYIFFMKKYDINLKTDKLKLSFNNSSREFIYIIFIIFSVLLTPVVINHISFLGIGWSNERSTMNQFQVLIFFCVYVSKYLAIGLVIKYYYFKYTKSKNNMYIFSTVILVLIVNSIFIGANRMDFILPFLSTFILLNYLYKNKMIIYNIFSVVFLFSALYIISLFRNTFDYQISNDMFSVITDNIQVYFAGLYNIALSLELDLITNQNTIITFLYDLVRTFLGLNLLWRPENLSTSSELFNQRIFGSDHMSQIIPLIGQFYNAFGILGVFFSVLLFTMVMIIFLKILRGSYIVTTLIMLVFVIRLALTPIQNLSIFINEFSSIVIIFTILNISAYLLKSITKNIRKMN